METINGPYMSEEQIREYLDRIEIEYPEQLTPEYLTRLQYAHITHIPFENLDVMNGIELSIEREHLFNKVIREKRGGICSELNTLYNWLLESLGFDVTSYISRIIAKTAPLQPYSHRVIAVKFGDKKYLTDVGFNFDHHRVPLLIEEGLVQGDGACNYRLERDEILGWIMYQETSNGWRKKLAFQESPQIDMDFIGPTFYAQYHRNAKINKSFKVSIHRDGEFIAVREGSYLKEVHGIVNVIEKIESRERELMLIKDVFGL